jgi:hypothetical protein
MKYMLIATHLDNDQRCFANRPYALGEYAATTFDSAAEAEEIADVLRDDVGTVVDESVEYEVIESR